MRTINPAPSFKDALRLNRLRGLARQHGYKLARSRWHQKFVSNLGGLVLLDVEGNVVSGAGYSLDLNAAEAAIDFFISRSR